MESGWFCVWGDMTYQVGAMIKDAVCDEFRVLCARDLEFGVVVSLVLLVERTRSLYQRTGSLATAPQKDSLVRSGLPRLYKSSALLHFFPRFSLRLYRILLYTPH
jgi:hypothetical protein